MIFKFLHLADIHLDTTFLCRTASLRARLRDALRCAFERAVDAAIEEGVHAVLIAGDLFDSERLSFTTERFLLAQLHRLDGAGIPCFYVTGNHDPGGLRYRGGHLEWPASFHRIGGREPFIHDVTDCNGRPLARIVGMGHATSREEANLAGGFPVSEGRIPHVGLLHAFVTSADQIDAHDRYAPCSLEDLRRTRYSYWALGHIHKRQQVCDIAEAWFPGNVQGRHARETGAKGGLMVTIDGSAPADVSFRSFAPVRWAELEIADIESAHTFRDIAAQVHAAFDDLIREDAGAEDWLLRIQFRGRTPLADSLRSDDGRDELEEMLASRLGALDVTVRADRVASPIDLERYRGEPHLLGSVIELLEEAEADPDVLRSLAPQTLAKDCRTDEELATYLGSLVEDLAAEAADRLLVE